MATPDVRLYYKNDMRLEVGYETPLQKTATGDPITTGSVTATIWDKDDNQVGGTLTLVHDTGGAWWVNIDDDFGSSGLTKGLDVTIKLTANAGAGYNGYWELKTTVEVRDDDSDA